MSNRYRLDYTIRENGLERDSCHYCEDLVEVNRMLEKLEQWKAWGFRIHELASE